MKDFGTRGGEIITLTTSTAIQKVLSRALEIGGDTGKLESSWDPREVVNGGCGGGGGGGQWEVVRPRGVWPS